MDEDILPDMGRMTARLPWAASLGCSQVPIAASSAPPRIGLRRKEARLGGGKARQMSMAKTFGSRMARNFR
jgi:hypothetical protein